MWKIFRRKACCLIVSMHKRHFSDHLDRLNIVLPTLILFTSIFTIPLSRSHAPHQSTNRSNVSKPQKILHKYIFEKTQNVVVEHDKTVKTKIHKNSFWVLFFIFSLEYLNDTYNLFQNYKILSYNSSIHRMGLSIYEDNAITIWALTICIFYEY